MMTMSLTRIAALMLLTYCALFLLLLVGHCLGGAKCRDDDVLAIVLTVLASLSEKIGATSICLEAQENESVR
jgi:hypothetical protein